MTKVEFIKQLTQFFSSKGFYCKSKHYYKEASSDVLLVFGFYMSCYGGYGYLEYGYCIKSINRHLPYPKFNQLNLNCGRIMTDIGQSIVFEKIDETIMEKLKAKIDVLVNDMINLACLGKDPLIQHYLTDPNNLTWYILGDETAGYFGLPKESFLYHYVKANM